MNRIVLIGGGGFAKEVLDLARASGQEVVGYVAPEKSSIALPYLGTLNTLPAQRFMFDGVVLAFGATDRRSIAARSATIAQIESLGLSAASVISPYARICSGVKIMPGSVIAHNVVLAIDSVLGPHCLLNNAAQLGHDAVLGRNVTLAPMAFVAGGVTVGDESLIGPSTAILEGRRIGRNVVVGVGVSVLRDIPEGATVIPRTAKTVGIGKPKV